MFNCTTPPALADATIEQLVALLADKEAAEAQAKAAEENATTSSSSLPSSDGSRLPPAPDDSIPKPHTQEMYNVQALMGLEHHRGEYLTIMVHTCPLNYLWLAG